MSKRKGITPLPWRADKVYCGYIWSGDKMVADFPMDEDEGTYLARMRGVGRGATQQEQQANAAFIVHACNRYDEAIRLLREVNAAANKAQDWDGTRMGSSLEEIEAFIAAEGKVAG